MRSALNSGWTVLVLLLSGTYLLAFAGTALATTWENGGQTTTRLVRKCQTLAGGGSCTTYDAVTCADKSLDPNLANVCPGYGYLKCIDFRAHGDCVLGETTDTCPEYQFYHCAELQFWDKNNCTYTPGKQPCYSHVYVPNGCDPSA